ncbi:diguanylate cyclase domain-containing protein [Pseudomonas sp. Gutcm_11s]|uniref:diguanylate cyclase domain-containing protein n=1 Tax=Pseudomonas sp. Gutcm_11s TaxID=3026088 RepID=UPI0023604EA7|nr:diguanylate cyclase [Pseudomonas sp. Gutcm_11s]MDD0843980.1 diguanylate cyclase [Pseudomonas sp. Gutcm_11s]
MLLLLLILVCALPSLVLLGLLLRRQRQLHQLGELLQQLEQGVLQLDGNERIRQHNAAAAELLGCAGQDLRGQALERWLPEPVQVQAKVLARGGDGLQRALQLSRIGNHLLLRPDQSDAERFQRSQYFARIGTWDWDIDTNRLYWSEAIYAMFGHQLGAVTPSYELFCQSVHPDDREHVRAGELRCIETGENHDEEYRVIWPDGSVHWLRETGNVIKDDGGTPVKMMGVVRDITEEKAWASQMHRLAHHDALTGLPNRLVFEERLGNALERARRSDSRVALVFIDLNGFKAINDQHGHRAGDQVLIAMANRLREALRGSDSVARLGGDEFVAVLEGLSPGRSPDDEGPNIAAKLLAALSPPVPLDSGPQHIGISLGIALFPEHAQNMDRLIHTADQAMYEAKRSGDNQYRMGHAAQRNG